MTIDERLEFLLKSTESLHASTQDLHATAHEHTLQLQEQSAQLRIDAENIRGLARIAEAHESRLSNLEGESNPNG